MHDQYNLSGELLLVLHAPLQSGLALDGADEYHYLVYSAKVDLGPSDPKKGAKLYAEVQLPGQNFHTKSVPCTMDTRLEWTNCFTVTLSPKNRRTARIIFCIKEKHRFHRDVLIGEAEMSIDNLLVQCQAEDRNNVSLNLLRGTSSSPIGSIVVRLEPVHYDITNARGALISVQQHAEEAELDNPNRPAIHITSATEAGEDVEGLVDQAGALTLLKNLGLRLDKLKLENMEPFIEVMDEITKIHPYVEAAWKVVSALYRIYEKKVKIEKDIVEVIVQMNDILSFVEDMQVLITKIKTFLDVIEEVLQVIDKCGHCILKYLNSPVAGQVWRAFSEAEQFGDFKSQLGELSLKLTRSVAGQAAVGVDILREGQEEMLSILRNAKTAKEKGKWKLLNLARPPNPSPNFIGREEYLKEMKEKYELPKPSLELGKQRRFVLYGPGGIGKTQLALQFLKLNEASFTVQYMVDATSEETLNNSFKGIGESNGISDPDTNKVLAWLREQEEDWMIFFDNADNHNTRYQTFIPDSLHGNILMTTRNSERRNLAPDGHYIEVSILDEEPAICLLFQSARLTRTPSNEGIAKKLVKELGYFTLAIVQAGSFTSTMSNFPDLEKYYRLFKEQRVMLLKEALGPDIPYEDPVYVTWEISYTALPSIAQYFMKLCSFLYRDGISEELFRLVATSKMTTRIWNGEIFCIKGGSDRLKESSTAMARFNRYVVSKFPFSARLHPQRVYVGRGTKVPSLALTDFIQYIRNEDDSNKWNQLSFNTLIKKLRQYSLIRETSEGIYSMHPLIHSWARDRMAQEEQNSIQSDALCLLLLILPPTQEPESTWMTSYVHKPIIRHLYHNARGSYQNQEAIIIFSYILEVRGTIMGAAHAYRLYAEAKHKEKTPNPPTNSSPSPPPQNEHTSSNS